MNKTYYSQPVTVGSVYFLIEAIEASTTYVNALMINLSQSLSGLRIISVDKITLTVYKYKPLIAKGKIPVYPLGPFVNRHGVVSPNSTENCFKIALLISLYGNTVFLENGKNFMTGNGMRRNV